MNAVRSWLFIPGDSEKKLAKAAACGADAVIFDLEDSVALAAKGEARALTSAYLAASTQGDSAAEGSAAGPQLWVRINPLASGLAEDDLAAIMPHHPAGIMLPKADGPADVVALSAMMDGYERGAEKGDARSSAMAKIVPIATETPIAPFHLGDYASADLPRLAGLAWGAEDLSAALGASGNRGADGDFAFTYKMVRSLTLMAARAAGVAAIETLAADFRDLAALEASSREARREGFTGRLAIHPAQVAPINRGFTPGEDEAARARRIVAAFAAEPDAGVVGIDGAMYDRPHLTAAENVLALYKAAYGDAE